MPAQINHCPGKGRNCSLASLPPGTLWRASSCLPAKLGQSLASGCAQTLLRGALDGLAEVMLGNMLAAYWIGDHVPEPEFVPCQFADMSMLYLRRAESRSWFRAAAPFPMCIPSDQIMGNRDLSFQRLGMSSALPLNLRRCFSSSVVQLLFLWTKGVSVLL